MKIREMLLAGTFVTMMIISAYIIVPIGPVPITMQPLVVLLAGMLLGSRLSAVSICVWVMLGCVGLPVFNQGQGGAVMLVGPTGGFIIAFIITAWLVGYLTERDLEASYLKKSYVYVRGNAGMLCDRPHRLQAQLPVLSAKAHELGQCHTFSSCAISSI